MKKSNSEMETLPVEKKSEKQRTPLYKNIQTTIILPFTCYPNKVSIQDSMRFTLI